MEQKRKRREERRSQLEHGAQAERPERDFVKADTHSNTRTHTLWLIKVFHKKNTQSFCNTHVVCMCTHKHALRL